MKRPTILAALATALAASFAATAIPAQAAVSSASINDLTATLNLDGANDNVTVSVVGGLLVHGQTTGGLASGSDWDSAVVGDQTVPADGTRTVIVNGGNGNDSITVVAKTTELASSGLNGDGGDDVVTGPDSNDTLTGGEGDDRLVAGKGDDVMNGGAGNDTLVWNQGDGTDTQDGGAGNDGAEVNGAPTLGDVFTLDPDQGAGQILFRRTNLGQFTIHSTTERFEVNGLGGDDSLTANDGVGARTLLSVDGGTGADTVNGSDGADLILGGEANDVLSGGGGDDRIVGDRGNDTMNGGTGDDTLVWNNGDNTDVANGDAGRDDVEVNGAPAAGDIFSVQPSGARIKFDRPNLVPFSLDIGSSETMHANGLGGDDSLTVGEVGLIEVTGAGGAGNDTLTGGGSSELFLGGSGNDTINPGGGLDIVSGDDGDDQVNIRDRTADVARGGAGSDAVIADNGQTDILDGFEAVDRTPNEKPKVKNRTLPVTIRGGKVKVKQGRRVDQGERTGRRVRHLHRLAHSAHREGGQARRLEGRAPARQRALSDRTRRLSDDQGEGPQGHQPPCRPPGRAQGPSGRLDGPLGQPRDEFEAPDAQARHDVKQEVGTPNHSNPERPRPSRGGAARRLRLPKGRIMTRSRPSTFLAGAAAVALIALAAVGCGGGGYGDSAGTTPAPPASAQSATIGAANEGELGTILVNPKGRTLYLFRRDSGTKSTCFGACAAAWPPLQAAGKPTVGGGADAALLGTTTRSDGEQQVTYNGHPLYLYAGDENAGDTRGQGLTDYGASWYVLNPAGQQVSGQSASSYGSGADGGGS